MRSVARILAVLAISLLCSCGDEDVSSSGSQVSGVCKDKYGHVYQNCDNLWVDKDGDGYNGYNDINDSDGTRH